MSFRNRIGLGQSWICVVLAALIAFQPVFLLADDKEHERSQLPTSSQDPIPDGAVEYESPSLELTPEDVEKRLENLKAVVEGAKRGTHPLDAFRLLEQDINLDVGRRRPQWNNLELRLYGEGGSYLGSLWTQDFRKSTSADFRYATPQVSSVETVEILYQGDLLQSLRISIGDILFYGDYLVFLESRPEGEWTQLNFIDLRTYASSLGEEALPVFRIPVQKSNLGARLEIRNGELWVGSIPVRPEVLEFYSSLQQMVLNLTASFLDPATYERSRALVNDFMLYFDRSVEMAGVLVKSQVERLQPISDLKAQLREAMKNVSEIGPLSNETDPAFDPNLQQSYHKLQESLLNIRENVENQKRLLTRIRLLWETLSLPQPKATGTIRESLALLATSFSASDPAHKKSVRREGILQIINNSTIQLGVAAGVVGTLALGQFEWTGFIYQSLDTTAQIMNAFFGSASEFATGQAKIWWESAKATFSGLLPMEFADVYIWNGNWKRSTVGITALFSSVLVFIGTSNFLVNAWKLAWDMKARMQGDADTSPSSPRSFLSDPVGRLRRLRQEFIKRQADQQTTYYENLGRAFGKNARLGSAVVEPEDQVTFTPEEDAELRSILAKLRAKNERNSRAWMKAIAEWKVTKGFLASLNRMGVTGENISKVGSATGISKLDPRPAFRWSNIETLPQAITHFLFSVASFTNSGTFYATFYNSYFAFRSFLTVPRFAVLFLVYPNYVRKFVESPGEAQRGRIQLSVPTEWNGGYRNVVEHRWLQLTSLWGSDRLDRLRSLENNLFAIERKIQVAVLKKTYSALIEHVDTLEDLNTVVKLDGLEHLADPRLENLTKNVRQFFQMYYSRLFDESMKEAITEMIRESGGEAKELSTIREYKDAALDAELDEWTRFSVDENAIVDRVLKRQDLAWEVARDQHQWRTALERWVLGEKFKSFRKLDPNKNRQSFRLLSVHRQMGNAQAMARAVRASLVSFIVDKPIELVLLFVLTAGITSGISKPLHEEMFSADAWFYMSRYSFWSGYFVGVVQGLFSDIWMKLQQDEKNEGKFGVFPKGKDAKLTYFQWYLKKTFGDPDNSILSNQWHYIKIITANLRAAFVHIALINFLTLGRFDLDLYLSGYILSYLMPTVGIAWKLEQGFEQSAFYSLKDIPEKYHRHPLAQQYISSQVGRLRVRFNLLYKLLWENPVGFIIGNVQTIGVPGMGSRAWIRQIFGGLTPTLWASEGLDAAKTKLSHIPGASRCANILKQAITRNYTD